MGMTDEEMKEYVVEVGGDFKFWYTTMAENKKDAEKEGMDFLKTLELNDMIDPYAGCTLDLKPLDCEVY